jgi:hypothetical protein
MRSILLRDRFKGSPMLNRIMNGLIAAAMVSVLVLFELGMIARGDAFFIATAIVVVFTGQQLIARENMGFARAASSMLQPQTYRSRSSFAAYFACLALGTVLAAQVLAFA